VFFSDDSSEEECQYEKDRRKRIEEDEAFLMEQHLYLAKFNKTI
jgi:hypothetical protein